MSHFVVPSTIVLEVKGRDAIRYLNARLTNDIKNLPIGDTCLAAALTPQGKTEGLFSVTKLSDERAILVCDGGDRNQVISAFKRYLVADRVEVSDISSETTLLHFIGEIRLSSYQYIIKNPRKRSIEEGADILLGHDSYKIIKADLKKDSFWDDQEVKLQRMRAGIPSFPEEINEQRLFVEAAFFDAISQTKGCYVGQEVVERVLSHGKPPKVLRLIEFSTKKEISSGQTVCLPNGDAIGTVLSSVLDPENKVVYAFASIKNDPSFFAEPVSTNEIAGKFIVPMK